jgi:glycine hydroxymethyltransferase
MSNATAAARFSDASFNRTLADADPELFGSIQSENSDASATRSS